MKRTKAKFLNFFVLEVTARSAANMLGIHLNSVAFFYRKICQVIVFCLAKEVAEVFNSEVEIYDSYFVGFRKDKQGRSATGEVVVFGMFKHHSKVFAVVLENTKTNTLMKILLAKLNQIVLSILTCITVTMN